MPRRYLPGSNCCVTAGLLSPAMQKYSPCSMYDISASDKDKAVVQFVSVRV